MIKKHRLILSSFLLLLTGCSFSSSDSEGLNNELDKASEEPVENFENTREDIEEDSRNIVSFYAVGDNLIHEQIIDYAKQEDGHFDFKPIYRNLSEDIKHADLAFINQESIIGGDELGFSGYPSFNTPSDMAEDLVELGFDIVSGSNNHSLDKGTTGIKNTLAYWDQYKDEVLFTGVFNDQEHRDNIPIIEANGLNFSVLTYTYGTNGINPEFPYLLNYFDPELITNDVQRAQEMSDFVIVAAHMGDEHSFTANQMQLEYAQLFADLGVDLVVGGHSHTIQPIEWITGENGNEMLMVYSLGNFVAATTSDINLLGGSLSLDFVEDDGEYSIENVLFEPHVIHYETPDGDIDSRTNFELFKLDEYPNELAKQHALNNYEDNIIRVENYQRIVNEVIDSDFLE